MGRCQLYAVRLEDLNLTTNFLCDYLVFYDFTELEKKEVLTKNGSVLHGLR